MDNLATLDQFRAFLRVPANVGEPELPGDSDATADDVTMLLALSAASEAIRNSANRTFEVVASEPTLRTFTPYRAREFSALDWVFDPFKSVWQIHQPKIFVDDIQDLTGMTISNRITAVDITADFDRGWPYNAIARGKAFIALEFKAGTSMPFEDGSVEITAKWGWSAVPDTIVNATLIQASRFYKRRDAPFGIAGSDQMGNTLRLLAKVDPDVAVMISSYSRIWGAV